MATGSRSNKINSQDNSELRSGHIKSDFVTVASHQLRTPISAIRWTLDSLRMPRNGKLTQKQLDLIDQAYQSNDFMVKVVRDLLRVSRIQDRGVDLHYQQVDLKKMVENLVDQARPYIKAFNSKIITKFDPKLPKVKTDPQQIKVVISALLDNAVMYGRRDGRIEIKLKANKKSVTFSIKDNGIGILANERSQVFDKFFRGANAIKIQANGLGLNLHIAKLIIEAMGGKIWFTSRHNIGTTFYFEIPTAAKLGKITQTVGHKSNHKLETIQIELKSFYRFLSEGLILIDKNGKVVLVNPLAERFFNVKEEKTVGKKLDNIFSNNEILNIVKERKSKTYKLDLKNKHDTYQVIVSPILSNKITIEGWLLLIQSTAHINEPADSEGGLKKEREFVAITLHELKAPLGMSKWGLELLQKELPGKLNKKQSELVNQIYRGNQRLLVLVRDLLNLSKLQEGKFNVESKPIDITRSINDSVSAFVNLAKEKSIKLKFEKPAERLPKVLADENRITQVLTNIVSNAVKYTPQNGHVTVRAEVKTGADMSKINKTVTTADIMHAKNKKGYVVISCQDTGIGISRENQKKMFSRFFRAKNVLQTDIEGTGLGLYITKSIVNLHKGDIWFTSTEGKGSTFYFSLPISGK